MPEVPIKKKSPICPHCAANNTYRSRRIGLTEWFLHYFRFKSPYRCRSCHQRFFHSRLHRASRDLHPPDNNKLHHHPA